MCGRYLASIFLCFCLAAPAYAQAADSNNLEIYNGCGMEGDARSSGVRALNRLKNRYTAPQQIDPAITLAAMLAPGRDTGRWKVKQGATAIAGSADRTQFLPFPLANHRWCRGYLHGATSPESTRRFPTLRDSVDKWPKNPSRPEIPIVTAQAVAESGVVNVELRESDAERLPIRDGEIDIAIVNGIFNLNPARDAIFHELARVIKPAGTQFAAELILSQPLPSETRASETDWFAWIAGAKEGDAFLSEFKEAGFSDASILRVSRNARTKNPLTLAAEVRARR
jgi:SAM-dependent methyltransferase